MRGNNHHKQRHANLLLNGPLLVFNKNVKVGENIKKAIKTSVVENVKHLGKNENDDHKNNNR